MKYRAMSGKRWSWWRTLPCITVEGWQSRIITVLLVDTIQVRLNKIIIPTHAIMEVYPPTVAPPLPGIKRVSIVEAVVTRRVARVADAENGTLAAMFLPILARYSSTYQR